MTVTTVRMASLPFTKGAGLRFPLSALTNVVTFPPLVIQGVHLPDNYLLMPVFDVDLPVSSLGGHPEMLNYAIIGNVGFWANIYAVAANALGVVTFRLERDAASAVYGSEAKGMFSALPTVTRPVQRANQAATLYTKRKITLPRIRSNYVGYKVFWVQITTNRSMLVEGEDNLFHKYGFFSTNSYISTKFNGWSGSEMASGNYPTIYDIVNQPTKYKKNSKFSEKNILDISISERCPYPYVVDNGSYSAGYYYTVGGDDDPEAPSELYSSSGRKFYIYDVSERTDYHDEIVNVTLSDLEKVYGAVNVYTTTNDLACNLGNDRNWQLSCRCVTDLGSLYTLLYDEEHGIKIVLQEGHLPYAGDSWQEYRTLTLNYDRELMSINQNRADAEAANGVGSGLASGILAGIVTGGNPYAAVATSAVSLVSTFIGRSITVKAEKDQQSVNEDMQRIQPSTAYNVGYGFSYIYDAEVFGGAYIAVMMPSEVDEDYLANHIKMNGYPAVGMRSITFGTGFYRGYIMSFDAGPGTHPLTNKLVFDLMNAELADGIRFVTSREDI